jgi:hypothetical protein
MTPPSLYPADEVAPGGVARLEVAAVQTDSGIDRDWLRDARQAELQKLFAYVVLAATIFFGQVTVWGALDQVPRALLPPPSAVVVFVVGADFMMFAFGFAAIARYDLVGVIEQRLGYPSKVLRLLSDRETGETVEGSRAWLTREFVLFGSDPRTLGADGWVLRRLEQLSPRRVWLPRTGLALVILGMSWLILRLFWPWL